MVATVVGVNHVAVPVDKNELQRRRAHIESDIKNLSLHFSLVSLFYKAATGKKVFVCFYGNERKKMLLLFYNG